MLNRYGFIGLWICIGLLFGFYFSNFEYFKFDSDINLIDFVNLLVSIFLAVYISVYLQNQKDKKNVLRDYYIKELNLFSQTCTQLNAYSNNNSYPFESTKSLFKESNLQLKFLEKILGETDCKDQLKKVQVDLRYLRRIITGISPQNGAIILDQTKITNVERRFESLKTNIYYLLKEIIHK